MDRRQKVVNLVLHTYGNYLGMDNGCIVLRDKEKNEQKYPLFESEIGEIVLTSGNMVSTERQLNPMILSPLGENKTRRHFHLFF